jgi:hypothetical protein
MLDVIGATVIGAVFILAMVTAVYNVQVITHNSNMMLTNTEITDRIVTAIDSLYMPNAGLGVTDGVTIKDASARSFRFKGMVEGSVVDTILIRREGTQGNYTLNIYKELAGGSLSRQMGPFALTDDDRNLKFTYYKYADNGSGLEPTLISGSADWQSIRLVQIDIDLQQTMVRNDIDPRTLHNHVRTWVYLKSLFITQGP